MPAAIGLSTYRWNNNLKSLALLLAFPLLLQLLVSTLFFLAYRSLDGTIVSARRGFQFFGVASVTGTQGPFDLACAVTLAYWPYLLGVALTWLAVAYLLNDELIHRTTGARPIERAAAPRLYTCMETLCISRGMAVPSLYMIETDGMNAYASGIDKRSYSITVTRGLIDGLTDAELEAVLAHELMHIIERDVRILLVTVVFVGMISYLLQLLGRTLRVAAMGGGKRGGFPPVILIAVAVAGVGYLLALSLRFAISRRREYLADAGSVELTKNPEALISALKKISAHAVVPHVPSEVGQMFIENPRQAFELFATHPPLQKRIERLDEIAGLPPEPAPPSEAKAMAAQLQSLGLTLGKLQAQIATTPAAQRAPHDARPTSAGVDPAAPRASSRGLRRGDAIWIAIGLAIGAGLALAFL